MAEKRDYYEVLGVPKTASAEEIKKAFRKKAKDCHPDLHPGDKTAEKQFKELNEAAGVLCDAEKRAKYDQFGHAAFDPGMGGQDPFSGGGFGGFADIFGQMFNDFGGGFGGFGGGSQRSSGPAAGDDLRYSMTLTFEEAAFGVRKDITVPREETCTVCGGSGAGSGETAAAAARRAFQPVEPLPPVSRVAGRAGRAAGFPLAGNEFRRVGRAAMGRHWAWLAECVDGRCRA